MRSSHFPLLLLAVVWSGVLWTANSGLFAQTQTSVAALEFPRDLVKWTPYSGNPIFSAEGPGHWDVKIRERGWIMRDGNAFRLWFTGYDGKRDARKLLGYATSTDGLHWTRFDKNPLVRDHWIEDMMVVKENGMYYMFAEGEHANHAEMLTSRDGVTWKWEGELDVRATNGKQPAKRPCGTPTVWVENGQWYLFYEWLDRGVWLAKTNDPMSRVWTKVQEGPVLSPGPGSYDKDLIAVDQVFKYRGVYFAIYHGSGSGEELPRTWNTDIARSIDLVHWTKYAGNPIVDDNKSSGEVVPAGNGYRLYTMHDQINAFESPAK